MVQINFAQKTVNVKIVYYGPGMSGKTTNLEVIHQRAPQGNRGDLTSISTDGDRTLFFDYMPLDLGTVAGMRTAFQLYTVPGQVYYNSTRKLVLQGVDGIIFVADSSAAMLNQNLESLRNLEENLNEYGKSLSTLPHVIQFNKRDLPDAMTIEELVRLMNPHRAPHFEAIANTGQGVFPTLKALAAGVLKNIMNESGTKGSYPSAPAPAPQAAPRASARRLRTAPRSGGPSAGTVRRAHAAAHAGWHACASRIRRPPAGRARAPRERRHRLLPGRSARRGDARTACAAVARTRSRTPARPAVARPGRSADGAGRATAGPPGSGRRRVRRRAGCSATCRWGPAWGPAPARRNEGASGSCQARSGAEESSWTLRACPDRGRRGCRSCPRLGAHERSVERNRRCPASRFHVMKTSASRASSSTRTTSSA
jgi:signal recognition particle receptor subunit beta